MPPPSRHDAPPWRWAVAWAAALAVLVGLTVLPRSLWDAVWPRGRLRPVPVETAGDAFTLVELPAVRPPRSVAARPDSTAPPAGAPTPDAAWWDDAWRARIAADLAPAAPAVPDSLVPAPLRDLWGTSASVELILAEPDSVVEARLWWLVQQEELAADDLDGLFAAIARYRACLDLRSREADIFDEFLPAIVPVTR